jgi:hypothetical protein
MNDPSNLSNRNEIHIAAIVRLMGTVAHLVVPSGFLKRNEIHIAAIVPAHGNGSPYCSAQRLPQEK